MDVTSDMYPGLIDGLVEKYGPSGMEWWPRLGRQIVLSVANTGLAAAGR